jgi:hypothetical protein
MPAAAADWIYHQVLTLAYRQSVGAEGRGHDHDLARGPAAVRSCACEWGRCHGCQVGRHSHCVRARVVSPAARILTRSGQVATVRLDNEKSVYAEVLPSGRACGWRCPCDCLPPAMPVAVVEPEPAVQLELFAIGGAR